MPKPCRDLQRSDLVWHVNAYLCWKKRTHSPEKGSRDIRACAINGFVLMGYSKALLPPCDPCKANSVALPLWSFSEVAMHRLACVFNIGVMSTRPLGPPLHSAFVRWEWSAGVSLRRVRNSVALVCFGFESRVAQSTDPHSGAEAVH